MNAVIKDVSTLSTVPIAHLTSLVNDAMLCIAHDVAEASNSGENRVDLDIEIGTLSIAFDGDEVRYRFVPNLKFKRMVADSTTGTSPILKLAEQTITDRVLKTYKELF